MVTKPRILLVPNASSWILGEIARQIIETLSDSYDFRYISELTAKYRPALLRRVLREVDLVHAFTEVVAVSIHRLGGPLPPLVTWIHHVSEWRDEHTFAVGASAQLLATTPEWAQVVRDHAKGTPVTAVGQGVDVDRFRRRPADRRRFGIPQNAFAVGFIGSRFSDLDGGRKGLDVLDAVVKRAAHQIPAFHVVFIGPGWEVHAATLRGAGISASTTGYVAADAIPDSYNCIDAYLVTSRVEGGPCTVLEAMASETPVVSTRVGLVPDVMAGDLAQFTSAIDDVESLTSTLARIAAHSAEERRRIGTDERAVVVARRRWSQTLEALRPVYAEMIRSHGQQSLGIRSEIDVRSEVATITAADALIGSAYALWKRNDPLPRSAQMLRSMMKGIGMREMARGLALVGGRFLER